MAGLGRSESAKVPAELGDLAGVLYDRAPAAPENPENRATPESPDTHAVTAEETEKK
jgi:cytochrome c biogenesis protein